MAASQVHLSDPTLAKIRAIMALEGITGHAGEVAISLANTSGDTRSFTEATVTVDSPYSVKVSTEESLFLAMQPSGELMVHVGPNLGSTLAKFTITRVDGFEYQLSAKETRYSFLERRGSAETRLNVVIAW